MQWHDKTFAQALDWAAEVHGDRVAAKAGGATLTYAQLAGRARDLARGLLSLGIAKDDKVALWMPDGLDWLVARWAVPLTGAVLVPINTRFRNADLRYALGQSDSVALILAPGFRSVSYFDILEHSVPDWREQPRDGWRTDAFPQLRTVLCAGGDVPDSTLSLSAVEAAGAALRQTDDALDRAIAAVSADDVAQILYTSGTTSFPKGAMVAHGPLLQNNWHAIERYAFTAEDRYLLTVPLFSATGTSVTLTLFLAGATLVVQDHYEVEEFCRTIERERITASFFVEPIVQDIKATRAHERYDLSSLRTGSGVPLGPQSIRWVIETLGVSQWVSVYGLSETSNAATRNSWNDPVETRVATVGPPSPGVRLRIVDIDDGSPLPPGKPGEILIKGYTVTKGYYRKPEETAKAIDAEGWLHTGDLGELTEDGRLVFRGRIKEMIKPGGHNVAALEIEEFLKTFPGVREAVIVGVPDTRFGEVPYAFVEPEPGETVDAAALLRFCKDNIAGYKVPRHVAFVDAWPRTSTGKTQRLALRERAVAAVAPAPEVVAPEVVNG
ncbi:AMP-binding protein [Azospirillum melinis]